MSDDDTDGRDEQGKQASIHYLSGSYLPRGYLIAGLVRLSARVHALALEELARLARTNPGQDFVVEFVWCDSYRFRDLRKGGGWRERHDCIAMMADERHNVPKRAITHAAPLDYVVRIDLVRVTAAPERLIDADLSDDPPSFVLR